MVITGQYVACLLARRAWAVDSLGAMPAALVLSPHGPWLPTVADLLTSTTVDQKGMEVTVWRALR